MCTVRRHRLPVRLNPEPDHFSCIVGAVRRSLSMYGLWDYLKQLCVSSKFTCLSSLSFFCSFEEYSVTIQKVLEGRTAVHFMAPLSQLFFFLCLFSLCATISIVFKSKLSPLINLRQGNILYVRQLCSIATHMYFSHLAFYLSNWSDCRLQSP